MHTPHDLSSGDKAKREAAIADWTRAVEIGAELGSPIINMVSSHAFAMHDAVEIPRITTKPLVQKYGTRNVPRGVDWDRNYDDYVEAVRACAEACGKAGVMMSVEPHPGRYLANTDGALRLLEHVDHHGDGHQLRSQPHLPDGRLSQHHRLSPRQKHHPHPCLGQ